jgi:antitoxin ParD1/3/4
MNVSLPKPLKQYVDDKVSSGVYGTASEFVREAIREKYQRDQDRQEAKAALADKLLKGLDSGDPIPFTDDYIEQRKKVLIERVGRKSKRS